MNQKKSYYDIFTSKSNVLKYLNGKLNYSVIEPIFDFTIYSWNQNESDILQKISKKFKSQIVIVRSSAQGEDSVSKSEAGNYQSIQNVHVNSKNKLRLAITKVISSYREKGNNNKFNQILIQNQSLDVVRSGVIFTRSNDNGSPYYIINFDEGNETDSVTKGEVGNIVKIFKNVNIKTISKEWKNLIKSVKEIEKIIGLDFLDIEFGINKHDQIIIFQVRPLIIKLSHQKGDPKLISRIINNNKKKFLKFNYDKSLPGSFTIFSDMCDWNPAEIIGSRPNILDCSLYDHVIMKDNWSLGREVLGYSKVKTISLMTIFSHKPYVDTRASFNSLIPTKIPKRLKQKLVNFYIKKLSNNPFLHDKSEFEILFTCNEPTLTERLNELEKNNFSEKEILIIKEILEKFTHELVNNFSEIYDDSTKSIKLLQKNRDFLIYKINSSERTPRVLFYAIQKLLDDCKNFGTLTFSSMARLAFVSSIILRGLVSKKLMDAKLLELFMNSLETPLSDIQHDVNLYVKKEISKDSFLKKYGHLRPGTYDIRAIRYDDNHDFFNNLKFIEKKKTNSKFDEKKFLKIITEYLPYEPDLFFYFIKKSITQREYIKFEFTKNLSLAIELIAEVGDMFGFSRDEMANLPLKSILKGKELKKQEIKQFWKKSIEQERKSISLDGFVVLPPLIISEKDFEVQHHYISKPNFISSLSINSEVVMLSKSEKQNLSNKIILIENADPGYDWIFTKNISGLITKYGGVASHMAIRCSELGLPAAIGCGDILFDKLTSAKRVLLDCKHHQVIILQNMVEEEYAEEKKLLKSLGYIK